MSQSIDIMKFAVLYVDDEEQALKYFRRGFDKQFRVLTAPNVAQAISLLEDPANGIGVVISDQKMPGRTGVDFLTEAKQRWPAIVRILITAHTEIEDAIAAVNAGAIYKYINKPAEFSLLREILNDALGVYRQTIERDALATTLAALEEQRKATQIAEAQREELQLRLISASRDAGRAEVATGVLHNVGNVLNSVNISAAMVKKTVNESKIANLSKALAMLDEHATDLAAFLTADEKGMRLPGYLQKLATVLAEEHGTILSELASLERSLEHIGRVVQMQQTYAKGSNLREQLSPSELIDDAVRINLASFDRHHVHFNCEYAGLSKLWLDKHRVLQILINLISNATNAVVQRDPENRKITVRAQPCDIDGRPHVRVEVIDNGSGISSENLTRIFIHGFTTREDGHGFGLHSSANAAREMGGSLSASSEGLDKGATFTLVLPVNDPAEKIRGIDLSEKAAA
jgi:two-component system, NtrC family, sensor kinase